MTPFGPVKSSLTSFLEALRISGGLRFEYTIRTREADPATAQPPRTEVLLTGPDTPLLLDRNGELLHAFESLAAAILRLEPDQAEQLSFDAGGYRAAREAAIARLAEEAIATVKASSKPFLFAPMNSRERRLLHLALVPSGLATASSGLGPRRFVVLYPAGQTPEPERFEQPSRQPVANRAQGNVRQGRPLRNNSGYKAIVSSRRTASSSPDPGVLPATPPATFSLDPQDPDSVGNRDDINATPADKKSTTDTRLDSIRRAFRKR